MKNKKSLGMRFLNTLSPIILAIIAQIQLFAQSPPKVYRGKISQQIAVNSTTPIYKGFSHDVIAYSEYQILVNKKNTSYQLEPLFDAYGKASSFRLFKTSSSEEQRTIHFNPQLMPEVGEELPLFIMKGLDGVTYNSTKLKGRYVLLSFWVRFEKPYYTLASTRIISDFIKKQKVNGIEVVSLATTHNSKKNRLLYTYS